MTETPRRFDPTNPDDAPTSPHAGSADATPASAEQGLSTDVAATGTDVDATTAGRAETSRPEEPTAQAPAPAPAPDTRQVTRAGMVWAAVACALVVLILLIAFILQNQEYVQVKFFGLEGSVPLGIALFIAAVGGGVLVAIAGAARIIQLRLAAHRVRRQASPGTHTR
ncbi:lipopolysaccharide assembly LapA domain-containing protein [Microbacterium sp. Bi128]|uniref:LapA family protein n=1 Tax=Microbacterium sp. Bi128 TaxID=2821115 RepID=UPI001DAB2649|nr:lipopolysaccharide assembly protein LapA domain-containing protein [Microbacterium sp. Bi128]CAH0293547.1 putative membrane protein Rv3760 [Microbacterium sp. Bi128]